MIVGGGSGKEPDWEGSVVERVLMGLYGSLLGAVLVVGAPFWLLRMATSGRYRAGLWGRLGVVPAGLREAVRREAGGGREVVWLHAVSVGEVMAAVAVVRRLVEARPGLVVAVSSTTATGQELAKRRLPGVPVFYLPLDFGWAVRGYLAVLKPRMLVLMESELWPNLLRECGRAGVAVAVVNARVSDRSYPRYMRLRRLWRPLLGRVGMFLAQGGETAERLRAMGVDAGRVRVVGNLKYDLPAVAEGAMVERLRAVLPWPSGTAGGARVVVCGSTLEGEEAMLLGAWPGIVAGEPRAVMVLAPRHPDRFGRVVEMARAAGTGVGGAGAGSRVWRASELGALGATPDEPGTATRSVGFGDVVVLDTIGDLAGVYSLGAVAFVGGSLLPAGGHNPLEPARFGVPVVVGSSFGNFREVVERMQAVDGIRVVSEEEMPRVLGELLRDEAGARAMGERGKSVFRTEAGATERTVEELLGLMGSGERGLKGLGA